MAAPSQSEKCCFSFILQFLENQNCVQRCVFAWRVAVQLRLYWMWINARWRLSGLTRNKVANMLLHYLRQLADQSMLGASDLSVLPLRGGKEFYKIEPLK